MAGQTADYQTFKRPMTDPERASMNRVYKNAQKQARPAGFMALVFAAIGIVNGANSFDFSSSTGMISVLIIAVGLMAFVMAYTTSRLRRTIVAAHNDGNVVVVRGPVSRYQGRTNGSVMMVGPLTIGSGKRGANPLQEGTYAEVACIPKLKSIVSLNGAGLEQPIKVGIPNDLESQASVGSPTYPPAPLNSVDPNIMPSSDAMSFCSSCGKPTQGLAYCWNCGNKH